jgi:hypothetical protein
MADVKAILSDPNYINANPATKRAIFDKRVASDPAYAQANPATQTAIRKKFGLEEPAAQPERTVMGYLGETAGNIIPSAAAMGIGMYEAITNPVQTAKGLGLAAYGGARNLAEATLPEGAFDVIKSVENPEVAKQAVDVANAIGGIYKNRYGSVNQLLDTIRTDPVGAAADLSIIFSGGAGLTTKAPTVSKALGTVGRAMDPIGYVAGKTVETGARVAAAGVNRLATSAQGRFLNELSGGLGPELVTAARTAPRYPGVTPTFAEATTEVPVPSVQAFGKKAADIPVANVEAEKGLRAKQTKMLEDLKTISKTPKERADMETARDAAAKSDYGKAFSQTVTEDKTLRALFATPSMKAAVNEAAKIAAERKTPFSIGKTRPQQVRAVGGRMVVTPATTAQYTVENLHLVKQAMDDILKNPDNYGIGATEAAAIKDTRGKFLNWLETRVDDYRVARENYAKASKEIARADWGDYAVQKLTSSMSEDAPLRARNFANAVRESLGPNAPASLKRAVGGGSRYQELTQLLNKDEMKIVNDAMAQLGREEVASGMASRGAVAAPKLEDLSKTDKLQLLDRFWTAAQFIYGKVAGRLSEAKKAKLALAMLNADTMADLMDAAVKRQQKVEMVTEPMRAAGTAARKVIQSPTYGTAGARLQTEENRNAFLTDALGQSYDVQGNRMAR